LPVGEAGLVASGEAGPLAKLS